MRSTTTSLAVLCCVCVLLSVASSVTSRDGNRGRGRNGGRGKNKDKKNKNKNNKLSRGGNLGYRRAPQVPSAAARNEWALRKDNGRQASGLSHRFAAKHNQNGDVIPPGVSMSNVPHAVTLPTVLTLFLLAFCGTAGGVAPHYAATTTTPPALGMLDHTGRCVSTRQDRAAALVRTTCANAPTAAAQLACARSRWGLEQCTAYDAAASCVPPAEAQDPPSSNTGAEAVDEEEEDVAAPPLLSGSWALDEDEQTGPLPDVRERHRHHVTNLRRENEALRNQLEKERQQHAVAAARVEELGHQLSSLQTRGTTRPPGTSKRWSTTSGSGLFKDGCSYRVLYNGRYVYPYAAYSNRLRLNVPCDEGTHHNDQMYVGSANHRKGYFVEAHALQTKEVQVEERC